MMNLIIQPGVAISGRFLENGAFALFFTKDGKESCISITPAGAEGVAFNVDMFPAGEVVPFKGDKGPWGWRPDGDPLKGKTAIGGIEHDSH